MQYLFALAHAQLVHLPRAQLHGMLPRYSYWSSHFKKWLIGEVGQYKSAVLIVVQGSYQLHLAVWEKSRKDKQAE